MSIGFNWFKDYKIEIDDNRFYRDVHLEYLGGGDTSFSAGNIAKYKDLLEKYCGKEFPTVCPDFIKSKDEKLNLIEPTEMSTMCEKILNTTEVDEVGARNRFELFKELSDKGYYLAFDYE